MVAGEGAVHTRAAAVHRAEAEPAPPKLGMCGRLDTWRFP